MYMPFREYEMHYYTMPPRHHAIMPSWHLDASSAPPSRSQAS
jgi:hypothetical protein